jgi:hypothetical protein
MQRSLVSYLQIVSVSGPTCYAGEGGFSALTAYVKCDNVELRDSLHAAALARERVSLRCARLEIEGLVGTIQFADGEPKERIALSIEGVHYFVSSSAA